jgi:hypothetical protein
MTRWAATTSALSLVSERSSARTLRSSTEVSMLSGSGGSGNRGGDGSAERRRAGGAPESAGDRRTPEPRAPEPRASAARVPASAARGPAPLRPGLPDRGCSAARRLSLRTGRAERLASAPRGAPPRPALLDPPVGRGTAFLPPRPPPDCCEPALRRRSPPADCAITIHPELAVRSRNATRAVRKPNDPRHKLCPATSYSPTQWPAQYHRR